MRFLMLFVLGFSLGCASTHSFDTKNEFQEARVFNRYTLTLASELTLAPHEIERAMEAVLTALERGMKNQALTEAEQAVIAQFLSVCKWALGYQGENIQLALIDHPNMSFHLDGCIYLSVHNGPYQARRTLIHEFGHALGRERAVQKNALSPRWWFRFFPSVEITQEIWAGTTVALLFQRIGAYSDWRPQEHEWFSPFEKTEKPVLWNYFLSWEYYLGYPNAEGKRFVNALRKVRNYDELVVFCAKQEQPKYALMRLCTMFLEAHFQNIETLWVFLHTCDDEVLEDKINETLCGIPADLAIQQFLGRRREIFHRR